MKLTQKINRKVKISVNFSIITGMRSQMIIQARVAAACHKNQLRYKMPTKMDQLATLQMMMLE